MFGARVCFSSMAHVLKSLDLSYNELDEVPFQALQPLKSLDWLNLHRYVFCCQKCDGVLFLIVNFIFSKD
jgi:hypothetical protein